MPIDSKIKIRQVEAFQGFMITGTVTATAKLLCVSQPAISKLLSDLEYRIGFPLFIRSHNKLTVTPEAKLFYLEVKNVFVGMNRLAKAADDIARNNKGQIRIGVMPICSNSFMVDVISEFSTLHPNVTIELESAPRNQLVDMIKAKQIDTAIVTNIEFEDDDLDCQFLCRNRALVILWEDHPLAHKSTLSPIELKNERFMTLAYGSPFRTRVEDTFIQKNITRNIVLEAREQSTLFQLVKKKVGIAILDPFVTFLGMDGVVTCPFEPVTEWDYFVVQSRNTSSSGVLNAFNQLLLQYFHQQRSSQFLQNKLI